MLDTASRMLRLLSLLQGRPQWSAAALADELGVSTRTIRADVERVRALGYDVDASAGTGGGYRLRPGSALPPMTFTDDESLAIAVALHTAATSGLAQVRDAATTAASKLDRVLPSRLRRRLATLSAVVHTVDSRRDPVPSDTFAAVAAACQAHEQLRFTYRDRHRQPSERRVEPHRLVHVTGRWYLAAFDLDRDEWRSFRLDRIEPRVPTGPRFTPREPPTRDWETLVVQGRMSALWNYRARVVVHADADTVTARVPTGTWAVEPRTAATCWLDAGAHSASLLAVHLGALELDLTIDPHRSPELHRAARELAARYTHATASDRDLDDGRTPAPVV